MRKMFLKIIAVITLVFFIIPAALCEEEEIVRILHLGEINHDPANKFIKKAIEDAQRDGLTVESTSYYFTDSSSTLDVPTVCNELEENNQTSVNLVIDSTKLATNRKLGEKIATNLGTPVITFNSLASDAQNTSGNKYHLRFTPPNMELHLVIKEIVYAKRMTDYVVIFPHELEWNYRALYNETTSRGVMCAFVRYDKKNIKRFLVNIKRILFNNIFLVGNVPLSKQNFTKTLVYSIIFNPAVPSNHDADVIMRTKVKDLQLFNAVVGDEEMALEAAFYYEVTLMGIKALMAMSKETKLFNSKNCESPSDTQESLDYQQHFIQLEKTIFQPIDYSSATKKMKFTMEIVVKNIVGIESFEIGKEINAVNNSVLESIKSNKHYHVLARIKPPFVYYDETTEVAFGYLIDMLDIMASMLDFTYNLTVVHVNNSKDFITLMVNESFDLGLGPIYEYTYTYRDKHDIKYDIEYSIPYYRMVGITFLMKDSKADSIFTFANVLEPVVWTCIFSAYFISSFMLWVSERLSPSSYRNNKEKYAEDPDVRDFTIKESLWFCMTSITSEGGGIIPKQLSGRMIVVTWWLFGFIILASYTANLAAFLTLSKMKSPIQDFDDLHRYFQMRYAPLESSDEAKYFQGMLIAEGDNKYQMGESEYPTSVKYTRINDIIKSNYPVDVERALERVHESPSSTEGFAFIVDEIDARYFQLMRCNLIQGSEVVGKRNLVIAVPSRTLLKHYIDRALSLIDLKRLELELDKKWFENNTRRATCVELEDESDGIGIYNIGGVFLIILIGIATAMLRMGYDYLLYIRRIDKVTAFIPEEEDEEEPKRETVRKARVAESAIPAMGETEVGSSGLQRRNVGIGRY